VYGREVMKQQVHDPQLKEGIMRRGFPRPVFDTEDMKKLAWYGNHGTYNRFLPTPYTALTDSIAMLSEERASECLRDVVCSVCGEAVEFNEHGWIPVLFKDNHLPYEAGPFHEKCAYLTMKLCPHIARSDSWSVGMINIQTYIRHQEHWSDGMWSDVNGLDCNPVSPTGHRSRS
jgi:hypothetical protein